MPQIASCILWKYAYNEGAVGRVAVSDSLRAIASLG
jgi:hypothetical protein